MTKEEEFEAAMALHEAVAAELRSRGVDAAAWAMLGKRLADVKVARGRGRKPAHLYLSDGRWEAFEEGGIGVHAVAAEGATAEEVAEAFSRLDLRPC